MGQLLTFQDGHFHTYNIWICATLHSIASIHGCVHLARVRVQNHKL